jgi:hypothetical protein
VQVNEGNPMFLSFLFFFYEVYQKFYATRFKLIPNSEIPSSILTSLNSEQSFKHPSFDANYNKKSSSFFFHHACREKEYGCSSILFLFFSNCKRQQADEQTFSHLLPIGAEL